MTRPTSDELAEYVLGTLPEAHRLALRNTIAVSPDVAADLALVQETLGGLQRTLAPQLPRPSGRAALLSALTSPDRYSPFVDDLAEHLDLAPTRMRELLRLTDDRNAWTASEFPGIQVIDFASGPKAIADHAGFVAFPKGLEFPYHRHLGPELNFILRGSLRTDDGRLYIPGEALIMDTGSAHAFSFPHEDTMIAVVHQAFEFEAPPNV